MATTKTIYIVFTEPEYHDEDVLVRGIEVAVMAASAGEAIDLALADQNVSDKMLSNMTVMVRKLPLVQQPGLRVVQDAH